jgi:hypothetical protein
LGQRVKCGVAETFPAEMGLLFRSKFKIVLENLV